MKGNIGSSAWFAVLIFSVTSFAEEIKNPQLTLLGTELIKSGFFWICIANILMLVFKEIRDSRRAKADTLQKTIENLVIKVGEMDKKLGLVEALMPKSDQIKQEIREELKFMISRAIRSERKT